MNRIGSSTGFCHRCISSGAPPQPTEPDSPDSAKRGGNFLLGSQFLGFFQRFVDGTNHVEGLFRKAVVVTVQNALEATDGFLQRHVFARCAGEDFGHEERLGQEPLDLTRPVYGHLVVFRQFVHTEDRDDVLQFLVTLQHALNATRYIVVLLANHQRVQLTAGRVQRIDRRVDTLGGDVTAQYHGCVQVGEGGCRRRVGQVIRRYVDRLNGGNGTGLGGGDPFLENAHFFSQRGLVTYCGRHPAQQCRYFGTCQGVTVDVVDEQQNVAAFVPEFLRHG